MRISNAHEQEVIVNKMLQSGVLATALLAAVGAQAATTNTWTGASNNNWDTTTLNWSGGSAYTDGDTVRFDETGANRFFPGAS